MGEVKYLFQLTDYRRSALIAACECDSITNRSFRTQTLNWLSNQDLLEPFDIAWDGEKMVTWYAATEQGKELVNRARNAHKDYTIHTEGNGTYPY